ncbi:DUF4375 domain-containing protein [Acidovorax sp. MR-S7]|uniref:DMP19 family protein n=1 Tax=Acidovorax sp. MR-S7 TaxID=1268622 RepID=UPI0003D3F9BF|nr:DUF4375 domain-containing protein [Acidovorax sp. MR-S7]GAD22576.1 hypothetical protein AVS7_02336 [Acidovorax sp. MR-S7]
MLPWNLEDWITDAGADVLEKHDADASSLSAIENAVYQVWLLDTEARNGGLSQYFCNHGRQQWAACQAAIAAVGLTSFPAFARALNAIVAGAEDPYAAIRQQGDPAEDLWYGYQSAIVQELKEAYNSAL